jgi:hypothetical protein
VIIGFEAAISTVAANSGAPFSEFEPNGTRRAYVREIAIFSQAATALSKGQIGRPANTPTGGTLVVGQAQDPSNAAGTAGFTTTWATTPTAPTVPMRQFDFANVTGSGLIYTWPTDGELISGPTRASSVILWNGGSSTGPICSQYSVWAE